MYKVVKMYVNNIWTRLKMVLCYWNFFLCNAESKLISHIWLKQNPYSCCSLCSDRRLTSASCTCCWLRTKLFVILMDELWAIYIYVWLQRAILCWNFGLVVLSNSFSIFLVIFQGFFVIGGFPFLVPDHF